VNDLIRWKKTKRTDILKHVNMLVFDNNKLKPVSIMGNEWDEDDQIVLCAALWFKADGKSLNCPFLKWDEDGYECLIYDLRPDDCRQFPFDENGKLDKSLATMCPEVRRLS
jgi:Fe-S-cluster containining protein